MKTNYHTHTWRCHHAKGTEREYIESAIKEGIKVLGFSDHVPQIFPDGYVSHVRMLPEEAKDYVETLRALKEEYADRIDIRIGYEAEYFPKLFDDMIENISKYGYDYLILGQHFLDVEPINYTGAETDDEKILAKYAEQVVAGLETGAYSIVAHPDLINFTGSDDIYRKHMSKICECAKKMDIPVEINGGGFREHLHYPSERFFRLAAEYGLKATIGVDAHVPDVLNDEKTRAEMLEFAARCGIEVTYDVNLR